MLHARGQSTAELQQQHVDRLHRHTIHITSAGMAHANGPTVRATVNSTSWWWEQEQRVVLNFVDADTTQKATGATSAQIDFFFLFFSFISLIADGPHHYHPACGHKGSSHLSPVHALHFFYRDASSALLQLVNQWLNFTYSRSHAFRYERKNTYPTLVRIELTTFVLADVQLTY